MSGISSVNNTPGYIPPAQNSSPGTPAIPAAAPAASPAAAGDSVQVGGSGQSASGDLEMFSAADVTKDIAPPLPPAEEPTATAAPDIRPYEAPPTPKQDVQQSQPIKKTHFSIVEGPASPDP